jgi:hypothetical protein
MVATNSATRGTTLYWAAQVFEAVGNLMLPVTEAFFHVFIYPSIFMHFRHVCYFSHHLPFRLPWHLGGHHGKENCEISVSLMEALPFLRSLELPTYQLSQEFRCALGHGISHGHGIQ